MSAVNNGLSLKVAVCAAIALALTVLSSWSFVQSTATTQNVPTIENQDLGEVVIIGSRTVARN